MELYFVKVSKRIIVAVIFCILLGLPCLAMPSVNSEQKSFRSPNPLTLSCNGQAEELCAEAEEPLPPPRRGRTYAIDHRAPPSGLREGRAHVLGAPVRMRDCGSALRAVRFIHDQDGSSESPPPPTSYAI